MQEYRFDLILKRDLTEDEVESVAAWVSIDGDAPEQVACISLGVNAGVPYAACTVRAATFDQALTAVLPGLAERGAVVEGIELEPDFAF